MKHINPLLPYLLSIFILLSGCSDEADPAGKDKKPVDKKSGKYGGTLIIGMQQEPEILNESISSMFSGIYLCNLIFSKFVKHNDSMELECDLITEIPTVKNGGVSEDYLTYTYHLRDNAFWHDGRPVTSADVRFTCDIMKDPEINVSTRQGWDVIESVDTPDSHTVVFHLSEVYTNFVGDCFYDESVLPRHLLKDLQSSDFTSADFHKDPVGSGPFIFEEWESGSYMTLKANRDYYGEGPYLDRIIIKFILDGNSLMFQLESGEIMGADNVPNALLDIVSDINKVKIYKTPALFLEHIDLNCSRYPLDDNRVRRALSLAIDREEISNKIYNGIWLPAYSDEHPDSPFHTGFGRDFNGYNPELARELLREAGWRDSDGDGVREKGDRELKFEISTVTGRVNRRRTQIVLNKQLGEIGVTLEIKNYHPSVLFAGFDDGGILSGGKYEMALYAFMAPPDPSTKETSYSADFVPPAGQNYSYFEDAALTDLLSMGSSAISFERRKILYSEILKILAREVPVIPLLWITQVDAMPESLRNYRPNPTQSGDSWNANMWWLEK